MNEERARQRIRTAYHKLRSYRDEIDDDDLESQSNAITTHMDAIRQAGDGTWNEVIAKEYVQNFEEQVEEETEESAPGFRRELAEDAITAEADDPLLELGVSRREFRDELRRLDPDEEDEAYDSEDMREYIEDADDTAGEDERYRYRD